jgi:hypothetical protein
LIGIEWGPDRAIARPGPFLVGTPCREEGVGKHVDGVLKLHDGLRKGRPFRSATSASRSFAKIGSGLFICVLRRAHLAWFRAVGLS